MVNSHRSYLYLIASPTFQWVWLVLQSLLLVKVASGISQQTCSFGDVALFLFTQKSPCTSTIQSIIALSNFSGENSAWVWLMDDKLFFQRIGTHLQPVSIVAIVLLLVFQSTASLIVVTFMVNANVVIVNHAIQCLGCHGGEDICTSLGQISFMSQLMDTIQQVSGTCFSLQGAFRLVGLLQWCSPFTFYLSSSTAEKQ